jgi:hypothetical protein
MSTRCTRSSPPCLPTVPPQSPSAIAIRAERDQLVARNERLEAIIAQIRRAHFGRKSEKINDDQLALGERAPDQSRQSVRWPELMPNS